MVHSRFDGRLQLFILQHFQLMPRLPFSLQADEATAAQLQRQHNEAEESRQFEALQSKFGMNERVKPSNSLGKFLKHCMSPRAYTVILWMRMS